MTAETPPDWYQLDLRHVWHPYTQMATAPPPIPVVRAKGAYLYTSDGRAILDGISSWWVNLHGHCDERIAEAIAVQARTLDQVIFAGFAHEPAARLAARLADLAPSGLDKVFFSDDGSTAVEVALKMAFQYWVNRGQTGRNLFIALEGAYHGDTFGAMGVSGVETFRGLFRPLLVEGLYARNPYLHPRSGDADWEAVATECTQHLEVLLTENANGVAGVIIEPMIQGAAGMIMWPAATLREIRAICDRHQVLLIADEVFTGFGRTGKMFACEHGPIVPDILCVSKAITGGTLPLSATLTSTSIYDAFLSEDRRKTLFHGHSYTANPIACAAALAAMDLLTEQGLERCLAIEIIHGSRLEAVRKLPGVADCKCLGLVSRIELGGYDSGYLDEVGPRLYRGFLERNILLRPLGDVLYTLPPLAITDDDLHRMYDAIEEVLGEEASR